jgi:hypothetical protein
MRIPGEWQLRDDGVTRPLVRAAVFDGDGRGALVKVAVHTEIATVAIAPCVPISAAIQSRRSIPPICRLRSQAFSVSRESLAP